VSDGYEQLPDDLPVPADDGSADHLPGTALPAIVLRDTRGTGVALDRLGPGRTVIYLYPLSGRPGVDLPEGWDTIPGARGCTPETCGFRDHHADLRAAGAHAVYGLSSQSTDSRAELADRHAAEVLDWLRDHATATR
jgi:peroxiredoxin